jgi:HPt (histidine-containing phosphotransfer) domain-containing protein
MADLSFLKAFTKGDPKKMQRYIKLYLQVAPDTFAKMQQSVRDQDWEQLRIYAHSLKPQVEYMGVLELKAVLVTIENNVKSKKYDTLPGLFEEAQRLYRASETALKAFKG